MTRILGLDLSLTSTGVAHVDGTVSRLAPPRLAGVERLDWFRDHLTRIVHAGVELVVIEEYAFSRAMAYSHQIGELGGVARLVFFDCGVPWVAVIPSSLKKYATGKGNASKEDVVAAAIQRLGYRGANNDEADAMWLRQMGLFAYGVDGAGLVDMPAANRDAAVRVPWPALERAA